MIAPAAAVDDLAVLLQASVNRVTHNGDGAAQNHKVSAIHVKLVLALRRDVFLAVVVGQVAKLGNDCVFRGWGQA